MNAKGPGKPPDGDLIEDRTAQPESRLRVMLLRLVALFLALGLLSLGFGGILRLTGLPVLPLLLESAELNRNPEIRAMMQAIVRVQADNRHGTGFNIDASGLIITNSHIIENAGNVRISFLPDRFQYQISEFQDFGEIDLAIIPLKSQNLPLLELGSSDDIQVGEEVVLIGNPIGLFRIANRGTIAGFARVAAYNSPILIINSQIHRGNSGSPVINADGLVIGIIYATAVINEGEDPVALAIPVSELIRLLNSG